MPSPKQQIPLNLPQRLDFLSPYRAPAAPRLSSQFYWALAIAVFAAAALFFLVFNDVFYDSGSQTQPVSFSTDDTATNNLLNNRIYPEASPFWVMAAAICLTGFLILLFIGFRGAAKTTR